VSTCEQDLWEVFGLITFPKDHPNPKSAGNTVSFGRLGHPRGAGDFRVIVVKDSGKEVVYEGPVWSVAQQTFSSYF